MNFIYLLEEHSLYSDCNCGHPSRAFLTREELLSAIKAWTPTVDEDGVADIEYVSGTIIPLGDYVWDEWRDLDHALHMDILEIFINQQKDAQ